MALVGVIEGAARVVTIGVELELLVSPPPPPPLPQPMRNSARKRKESFFMADPLGGRFAAWCLCTEYIETF
jgi:hypothetical protein